MMNNKEFVDKVTDIAKNYKTLYVMGCFGAPMTATNQNRYTKNHAYNKQLARTAAINRATSDTFGFDCCGLIKAVLWGWNGNKNKVYGGASYKSNGVPDIGADRMIKQCTNVSTDFSDIELGEVVWMSGHIGVYIGNGLAVECTPIWGDGVQITACNCTKSGYNTRNWTKHGKFKYVDYSYTEEKLKDINDIAREVLAGKWGNGAARKTALTKAGYDYIAVQKVVTEMCKTPAKKTVEEIAKEVLAGKWGNGATRKKKLTEAGYDYSAVQKCVNQLLKK